MSRKNLVKKSLTAAMLCGTVAGAGLAFPATASAEPWTSAAWVAAHATAEPAPGPESVDRFLRLPAS
ncbi:hypothetical protein ABZ851_12835 [Streptomyces sp. NPDC047049]|uniref:hypothetical protein n=1 Tax=Streptomyces sp. NPDC047049 TaxID=3156688 RepID=UPI0033CD8E9B